MADAGKFFRVLLLLVFVGIPLLAAAAGLAFWFALDRPWGAESDGTVEFVVPQGATMANIAPELEGEGLVRYGWYVHRRYWVLNRINAVGDLKAGRYRLAFGSTPSELIRALTSPTNEQRVFLSIQITEGFTAGQIARAVEERGFASAEHVRQAIIELASEYPILQTGEGLQGYLFPDTYNLESPIADDETTSRRNAVQIVRMMADRFFDTLDDIDPGWRGLTAVQLHEKVTLASIVEREYRVEAEAPLIAAVFHNRLTEGMQLQSCATVVYAIQETEEGEPFRDEYIRFNRRIFERYLEGVDSPYNTYLSAGLPPGPISSPGFVSLEAAFYPADTDALFFVVKDPAAGTHTFTRQYADHLEARAEYLNQYVVKD